MGNKLVVMSDLHGRKEEPFFFAQKEFCNWFVEQNFNNENNTLIDLGDIVEHSVPNPDVYDMLFDFYGRMKFKNKKIMSGNHCYNRLKNSHAEIPLLNIANTEFINKPSYERIENLDCLFLPFMYDRTELTNNKTMEAFYITEYFQDIDFEYDFIFTHLQDETIKFSEDDENSIDLSFLKGQRMSGHIHKFQKGYLGSVLINNFAEKGKDSFIALIDTETKEIEYVKVPNFLQYNTIDYSDNFPTNIPNNVFVIYDIENAPSKEAAENKFVGLYIRDGGIHLKKSKEELKMEESEKKDNRTINDFFDDFCKKEKVSKKIKQKVGSYINE